jgi:predicted AlkP superfamily pyrophosphatase or phosphodiesterase
MLNEESVSIVRGARMNEHFNKPNYDTYSFARIPATIAGLLTGEMADEGLPPKALAHLPRQYDKVIVLLVDAFGWRFLTRAVDEYPFLKRFMAEGVVNMLSTQFPSTTTVHIPTIKTGLTVGETGLYEWFIYEPMVDAIITPLLYSFALDKGRNTLQNAGINPHALFPRRTVYQDLKARGVKSYVFQDRSFSPSPVADVLNDGARTIGHSTLAEMLVNLTTLVAQEKERAYFFAYWGSLDSICHQYGPESMQMYAETDNLLVMLERWLHKNLAGKAKNTLLLVTADHGQVEVSPEHTTYVNLALPHLEGWLKTNRKGQTLAPAGSARDMFFHVRPEYIEDAQAALTRCLEGKAEVHRVNDLIVQGYFGPRVSENLRDRVGDLVALPYRHEAVWWYEKGRHEHQFYGHHGGLTPEEAETILLALPYA